MGLPNSVCLQLSRSYICQKHMHHKVNIHVPQKKLYSFTLYTNIYIRVSPISVQYKSQVPAHFICSMIVVVVVVVVVVTNTATTTTITVTLLLLL